MKLGWHALLMIVALAGCAPSVMSRGGSEPVKVSEDPKCYPVNSHRFFIATETQIFRQGATVRIRPMADSSPFGDQELAPACLSYWSISGPARLSRDRSAFTIAPDAAIGSIVRIRFKKDATEVISEFRVVGRDEILLTGRYSQKSVTGCEIAEPVRELEFNPNGGFSVTFLPFETYKDYWGGYTFDPATGHIRMNVTGGNFVPPDLDLEGEAELASGRLTLRNVFLGSRQSPAQKGCTYLF